jgi:hypothetical protein
MTHPHGDEFKVINRGEIVEHNEKRPYGKGYTERVPLSGLLTRLAQIAQWFKR